MVILDLKHIFIVPHYWIDLADLQEEGIWKWVGQNVVAVYTHWLPNQPNDYGGNQDCVLIYKSGGWDDSGCNESHHYICETPKSE